MHMHMHMLIALKAATWLCLHAIVLCADRLYTFRCKMVCTVPADQQHPAVFVQMARSMFNALGHLLQLVQMPH